MLGAGALRRLRGMVQGGRREGVSGWGARVYLWRIHVDVSDSLRRHESQHARPPCPSPSPGVHSDSQFIYFNWRLITLQYCIGFAIHQHESATGIHVFPILNPSSSSLPVPSLWVVSVHQPQASSIMHRTWTGDSFHM